MILETFNDAAKRAVYSLQEFFTLAGKALGFIFVKPFYTADLFQQMDVIGADLSGSSCSPAFSLEWCSPSSCPCSFRNWDRRLSSEN